MFFPVTETYASMRQTIFHIYTQVLKRRKVLKVAGPGTPEAYAERLKF
jgi:hypothetical protein